MAIAENNLTSAGASGFVASKILKKLADKDTLTVVSKEQMLAEIEDLTKHGFDFEEGVLKIYHIGKNKYAYYYTC